MDKGMEEFGPELPFVSSNGHGEDGCICPFCGSETHHGEKSLMRGVPAPGEAFAPRLIHRACGGFLAVSDSADLLRIGVTGSTEGEALYLFAQSYARLVEILMTPQTPT